LGGGNHLDLGATDAAESHLMYPDSQQKAPVATFANGELTTVGSQKTLFEELFDD
jgi:hypothetical protein